MDFGNHLLGLDVSRVLQERASNPIFWIGTDGFTRGDLAAADCFNFQSAQNKELQTLLSKPFIGDDPNNMRKVRNTRDLYYNVPPEKLAIPGIGAFTMAVIGAAFEVKKLGGEDPLQSWQDHHKSAEVTFITLKHRVERDKDEEKKERRTKREQERRRKAQEIEDNKANRILAKAAKNLRAVPRKVANG